MRQRQGPGTAEIVDTQLIRLIKARLSERWRCEKTERSPYWIPLYDRDTGYNDPWFQMRLRHRFDRRCIMRLTYQPSPQSVARDASPQQIGFLFTAVIKQKKKKNFYYNLKEIRAVSFDDFLKQLKKIEKRADAEIRKAGTKIMTPILCREFKKSLKKV